MSKKNKKLVVKTVFSAGLPLDKDNAVKAIATVPEVVAKNLKMKQRVFVLYGPNKAAIEKHIKELLKYTFMPPSEKNIEIEIPEDGEEEL